MSLRDELEKEERKSNPVKNLIKKAKELVEEAVDQIKRYQTGKDKPIKTRFEHFNKNCLGGIFKGMIIVIAGISGSGKTHVLQEIENDIFNKELNPDCDDYVLLRCNWEMTVFKLVLRKLKRGLDKAMQVILFNETSESDQEKFDEICDSEKNDNIYYLQEPTDPITWYETVKAFLIHHKDKKQVIITIDHLALVRDLAGVKKKAMDDLVEYINSLKKEFTNVSFILISQANRDIESRTDVRHLAPKRSDLYNTDTLFQIADIVLFIHNAYKLGHDKYMVVSPKRYEYLIDFMDKPSNKRTNFNTKNNIFWHYLKIREIEDMEDIQDIFIETLGVPNLRDSIMNTEKYKAMVENEEYEDEDEEELNTPTKGIVIHDSLPDDFEADNEEDVPF